MNLITGPELYGLPILYSISSFNWSLILHPVSTVFEMLSDIWAAVIEGTVKVLSNFKDPNFVRNVYIVVFVVSSVINASSLVTILDIILLY